MQNNEEKTVSAPQSESSLDRPRYITFALITLIALFVSLNSLSVISSRQAHLANYERYMIELEGVVAKLVLGEANQETEVWIGENRLLENLKLSREEYKLFSEAIQTLERHIAEGKMFREREDEKGENKKSWFKGINLNIFRLLSNDYLHGLLLISCGIIGATISTLRAGFGRVSKTLILGASVGFIALLGVKGGTTIFTVSGSGIGVPLNPYSSALAGILAGMFSERLYIVLSDLIDKALKNRKSVENQNNEGTPP